MSNNLLYLQEIENFISWRQELYDCLGKRKSTQIDLIDALCSNQSAQTVVELTNNPLFKRKYSSIYKGIKNLSKPKKPRGENQVHDSLLNLISQTIPPHNKRCYHLFGIDVTPQPRQFSPTLTDRKVIHQPNSVKGHKPINIGHAYSWLSYLPEKENHFDAPWVIPLSVERVHSDETDASVANKQIQNVVKHHYFSANDLLVIVGDSLYSQRDFIGEQVQEKNVVVVTRVRSNRVFYQQFKPPENEVAKKGHPRWYGDKFDLKNSNSWHCPDDIITTHFKTKRGKLLTVTIKGWNNMLMRETKDYKLHKYPFTLLQVIVTNEAGDQVWKPMWLIAIGERKNELTLLDIYQSYRQRFDLEHFFRFGQQKLLMNSYFTPDTKGEENWFQLILIAYIQLWNARHLAMCLPQPWEKYLPQFKLGNITPSVVQRDFFRIISTIGTPAKNPKPRGFSSGRKKGEKQTLRPRHQVIKKGKKCQQKS